MSGLTEIVSSLRRHQRIIVTGPQRAGTTIAAKILACELGYRFVPEEHVGWASVGKLFELYHAQQHFVVQGPCFCAYAHLLPGAVVLMRRPVEEILRSQARIGWSEFERDELDRYFATQGPIAQVKYHVWDRFQKSHLGQRAFELDYHSLRGHALWVEEEQRKIFHPRQISRTSVDEAIVDMERALKLKPDDAEGHKNLGNALRLQGRQGKAVAHLQQAVRLKPTDAEAYHNLGQALTRQRRWNEAILCYRQALRLKPDFAEAHKHLGDVYSRRPDVALDELIASFREAIRLAPDDAEAHNKLGCTLMDMGLQDEAISALRRACQLRPNLAWLHSHLLALLHLHPDYDSRSLAEEHDRWTNHFAQEGFAKWLAALREFIKTGTA